jgi:hypothetical protein
MASPEFSSDELQTLRKAYVVHRAEVAALHAKSEDPEVWQAGMQLLEMLDADAAKPGHGRNDLFSLWGYAERMKQSVEGADEPSLDSVATSAAELDRITAIVAKLGGDPDAPSFGAK